ncbi:MAG: SUMF1/EgtB/PvdO family nonheme iron enzyme [Kiritimatiellae bacterium]|nr:SUMF1/EgtB/PvdO family nonheme iron enzyme [Kiritimatiellia bacterium]
MKRHALFVGVDQYADGHIPNLSCAVSDATDLHGFFKYGAGYDQVELLPNPSSKKEVLGKVRSLTTGLGSGDFFLFFFAGHGFRVGENHVLVCSNDLYDDVKYEDDGLPLGQLKRRLSGAFNSALLLDACQSDILAMRGGEGIAERDLSLIHAAPPVMAGDGALTIVTSCDAGQTAAELSERRHGLFTVAMLDLLREAQRAHSRIDLSDAFRLSLGRRMGEIAARFGLPTEQRPRFSCTGNSCFILLDGVVPTASATQPPPQYHQPSVAPTFVICPVCGFRNCEQQTFRCRVCGRDHLCTAHFDKQERCCEDCAAVKRRERADREAVERRAREVSLQNGTCRETEICSTITLPGGAKMEMIYCPPGEFMMGSPKGEKGRDDDETQHRVRLTRGFWLGKYPVTQAQWESVMGIKPLLPNGDDRPVEKISWGDCKDFIEKVNAVLGGRARMPTEAEWEYACRAGTATAYFWGNALNGNRANCDGNYPCGTRTKGAYQEKTTPVGRYGANPWGFCDMHGNVSEWCADWYGDYPSWSVTDPVGPDSGNKRVLRGGNWNLSARFCRSAARFLYVPGYRKGFSGFRLCCSAGSSGERVECEAADEVGARNGSRRKTGICRTTTPSGGTKVKMIVKVVAIIALAACAIPHLSVFAAGFFNSKAAGYVSGYVMACVGFLVAVATIKRDIRRNRQGNKHDDLSTLRHD